MLAHSPCTMTRAEASMLPAGVLLTHLYTVPSYTSTFRIFSVPFSKIWNRESCEKEGEVSTGQTESD